VRRTIEAHAAAGVRPPGLAVVKVGDDPASAVYVRNKRRACAQVGILSFAYDLSASAAESELLRLIGTLNDDARVDGILVQLPLPAHLGRSAALEHIDPAKDVDGFHPYNVAAWRNASP